MRSLIQTSFGLLYLLSAVVVPSAMAQQEEIIHSSKGGVPFMAVTPGKGGSKRALGFYSRNKETSEWEEVLLGKITPDPRQGPVLAELNISSLTQRFDAIAITDGRVTLFHADSSEKDPPSIRRFGSASAPVFDPVTQAAVQLPKITSSNQVAIHTRQLEKSNYELVMVSLQGDNLYGNGVTFGFIVEAPPKGDTSFKIAKGPFVVDYRFLSAPEMNQLAVSKSYPSRVFSRYAACSMINGRSNDHPCIAQWRSSLKSLVDSYARGISRIEANEATIPLLDLGTGRLEMEREIQQEVFAAKGFDVLQRMDVFSGEGLVFFRGTAGYGESASKHVKKLRGQVAFSERADGSLEYKAWNAVNADTSGAGDGTILQVEDTLYYVRKHPNISSQVVILTLIEDLKASPDQLKFLHRQETETLSNGHRKTLDLLVVTTRTGKDTQTQGFRIDSTRAESPQLEARFKIDDHFVESDEVFNARLWSKPGDASLYDHVTPPQSKLSDYQRVAVQTTPRLILQRSSQSSQEFFFLEALRKIELNQDLQYIEYDDSKIPQSQTGVYYKQGSRFAQLLYAGEIYDPKIQVKEETQLLFSKEVRVGKESRAVLSGIYASYRKKSSPSSGKGSLVLFVHEGRGAASTKPNKVSIELSAAPEKIEFMGVVQGALTSANDFYVMYSYKTAKGELVHAVIPGTLKYYPDSQSYDFDIKQSYTSRFDPKQLTKENIYYDQQGRVYFATVPGLDMKDPAFEVTSLKDGMVILPNTANNRGVKLVPPDKMPKDHDTALGSEFVNKSESWRISSPKINRLEVKEAASRSGTDLRIDVFPQLQELFEDLSKRGTKGRRIVLKVPSKYKTLVRDMIMSRWLDPKNQNGSWSHLNRNLRFSIVDGDSRTQKEYYENLESMRDQQDSGHAVVLFADAATLRSAGRIGLGSEDQKSTLYQIEGTSSVKLDPEDLDNSRYDEDEDEEESEHEIPTHRVTQENPFESHEAMMAKETYSETPHALYWIATEGRRVPLKQFDELKGSAHIPTVILASEEDWAALKRDADLERAYHVFDLFEEIKLNEPSMDAIKEMILKVFYNRQVMDLRYQYSAEGIVRDASGLSQPEAQRKLIEYLLNRARRLSEQSNKSDPFTGYMRLLHFLTAILLNDEDVRTRRLIDIRVMEKSLAQVYSSQINLSLLPETDFLRILSRPDVITRFTEAGYAGDYELKRRIIDLVLLQVKADNLKSIPSSAIIVGGSSTGKTKILQALIRLLNLKPYDFENPKSEGNKKANVFLLDVAKLASESDRSLKNSGSGKAGSMTADEAIAHLEHFISLPEGYRGFIFIDDLHAAEDDETLNKIITKIRSMVDGKGWSGKEDNVVIARPWESKERIEKPSRNLTLIATMNPILKKIQDKYPSVSESDYTAEQAILGTLSSSKRQLDDSFIKRIGDIISVNRFPYEAKGPTLAEKTSNDALSEISNNKSLVLASPDVISTIANFFRETDARTFLSVASRELIDRVDLTKPKDAYVILPMIQAQDGQGSSDFWQEFSGLQSKLANASGEFKTESDARLLEKFVRGYTQAISIRHSTGYMGLLKSVVDNFRMRVFESMTQGLAQDVSLQRNALQQKAITAPAMHALATHLKTHHKIPLGMLSLDLYRLGLRQKTDANELKKLIGNDSSRGYLAPVALGESGQSEGTYRAFIDSGFRPSRDRTRHDVINELVAKLQQTLSQDLAVRLRLKELSGIENMDIQAWLLMLKKEEPTELLRQTGMKLSQLYTDFLIALDDSSLLESKRTQAVKQMSPYDRARFFAYAMDLAIARIQWAPIIRTLRDAMITVTDDMTWGQSAGVQNFIFKSPSSPLSPITREFVIQAIESTAPYRLWTEELSRKSSWNFNQNCSSMLLKRSDANSKRDDGGTT